jgi:hypothetical protein
VISGKAGVFLVGARHAVPGYVGNGLKGPEFFFFVAQLKMRIKTPTGQLMSIEIESLKRTEVLHHTPKVARASAFLICSLPTASRDSNKRFASAKNCFFSLRFACSR